MKIHIAWVKFLCIYFVHTELTVSTRINKKIVVTDVDCFKQSNDFETERNGPKRFETSFLNIIYYLFFPYCANVALVVITYLPL